jgi:hypothetical protein
MRNNKGVTLLILPVVFVVLVIGGLVIHWQYSSQGERRAISTPTVQEPTIADTEGFKTFRSSEILSFEILVPETYSIDEELGFVTIKSNEGEIVIGRNGTEYDDLEKYITNNRNSLGDRLRESEMFEINGLEGVSGFLDVAGSDTAEKAYYIYADYSVYLLYTRNLELYDDLDQIAGSFRYMPN